MDKPEQDIRDEAWQDGYAFGRAIGRAAEQYRAVGVRGRAFVLGVILGGVVATLGGLLAAIWR